MRTLIVLRYEIVSRAYAALQRRHYKLFRYSDRHTRVLPNYFASLALPKCQPQLTTTLVP